MLKHRKESNTMKKLKLMAAALLLSVSSTQCMNVTDIAEATGFMTTIGNVVGVAGNGACNIAATGIFLHNAAWCYDFCNLINTTSQHISNGYGPELAVMVGSGLMNTGRIVRWFGNECIKDRNIARDKQNMEKENVSEAVVCQALILRDAESVASVQN